MCACEALVNIIYSAISQTKCHVYI